MKNNANLYILKIISILKQDFNIYHTSFYKRVNIFEQIELLVWIFEITIMLSITS